MINWLGVTKLSAVVAVVGSAIGFGAYAVLRRHGMEAPWAVAVAGGLPVGLVSEEVSIPRGLAAGTLVVWCVAAAESYAHPVAPGAGVVDGLFAFHSSLTGARLLWLLGATAMSVYLASRAGRSTARAKRSTS